MFFRRAARASAAAARRDVLTAHGQSSVEPATQKPTSRHRLLRSRAQREHRRILCREFDCVVSANVCVSAAVFAIDCLVLCSVRA